MRIGSDTPAVVTGGASGLGAAVARALVAAGAPVCLLDRDIDRASALAGEIGAHAEACDVADAASVTRAFDGARAAQGQERIAVCCAGVAPAAKTVSRGAPHDPAQFAAVVAINLLGTFYCASTAAAGMSAADPLDADGARGVIVTTASVAAFDGQVGQAAYAASKAGVAGLTLPMARDLSQHGIRVATIAPGIFRTPMLEGLPQDVQDSLGRQVPFPSRLGEPEEFAALVRHIVENAMLNGEVIRLDGGIRMAPR